jgi:NAD(P)-dependent dehydrogenase (short-subunit alcohol dehydrogenase family)
MDDIEAALAAAEKTFGGVDIMCNNAGMRVRFTGPGLCNSFRSLMVFVQDSLAVLEVPDDSVVPKLAYGECDTRM